MGGMRRRAGVVTGVHEAAAGGATIDDQYRTVYRDASRIVDVAKERCGPLGERGHDRRAPDDRTAHRGGGVTVTARRRPGGHARTIVARTELRLDMNSRRHYDETINMWDHP